MVDKDNLKKDKKDKKEKKKKVPTPDDLMKLEIAKEIGIMDKLEEFGWGGLTAKETGRIGGLMTAKKKKQRKKYA